MAWTPSCAACMPLLADVCMLLLLLLLRGPGAHVSVSEEGWPVLADADALSQLMWLSNASSR